MSTIAFQSFDKSFAASEKALNVLGWVPFVSTLSGGVRMMAGKIQAVAFAVFASLLFVYAYLSNNQKLLAAADRLTTYIWHGMANVCRGFVEMIPIGGNIATILYDADPASRLRYPSEAARPAHLIPLLV
jgi:hypothetical protein